MPKLQSKCRLKKKKVPDPSAIFHAATSHVPATRPKEKTCGKDRGRRQGKGHRTDPTSASGRLSLPQSEYSKKASEYIRAWITREAIQKSIWSKGAISLKHIASRREKKSNKEKRNSPWQLGREKEKS